MTNWVKPLPICVDHYSVIANDTLYLKCVEYLNSADVSVLNAILGNSVSVRKTYKLWILNQIAVSGLVEPYQIVFNVKQKDVSEIQLLNEVHILYNLLKQELKWPE